MFCVLVQTIEPYSIYCEHLDVSRYALQLVDSVARS